MLLSFVWTVALLTLIAEKKFGVKIIGSITMPLAVVCVILMQLLPSEVRPLVPALQSTWLHVHVTLAMLAYAACAVSFALAMMFLIKDNFKTETFLALTSATVGAIYVAIVATRFEKWGGLSVTAWDARGKSDMFIGRGMRLFVTVPDLGWLFMIATLAAIAPLALYLVSRAKKDDSFYGTANKAVFVSILLQIVVLAAFALRVRDASYPSPDQDGLFPTSLAASPFLLGGMVTGIFASLLYLMMLWRRTDLHRFSLADLHDCHRRLLGKPDLGLVLELGPEGDLGCYHLAGLCGLLTHADHARMARTQGRVLRHPGIWRRDLHLPRRHVFASRLTRVRMRN